MGPIIFGPYSSSPQTLVTLNKRALKLFTSIGPTSTSLIKMTTIG